MSAVSSIVIPNSTRGGGWQATPARRPCVELAHAHAAQSELRDGEPLRSKLALIHFDLLSHSAAVATPANKQVEVKPMSGGESQ